MNLLAVSLRLAAVATVKASSSENHQWAPPTANDVRSPSLGSIRMLTLTLSNAVNVLAASRTMAAVGKCFGACKTEGLMLFLILDGFNVGPDTIIQAAKFGLLFGNTPITLDLDALKLHNLVECDASISRGDLAVTGDNLHFNETIFTNLANANPSVDYYNASSAAHVQDERDEPQHHRYGKRGRLAHPRIGSVSECDGESYHWRRTQEGRSLPIAEGWKRLNMTITAESLNPIQNQIFFVSNYTGPTQPCKALVLGPNLTI
ncbi:hypothetical protein K438DRAFT_1994519 [Mycena galopus ATCC 62051]|nr:hypothetical protein K438DRAFT_1994519 [Mycena galopus ATCC 62051]